MPRRSVRAFVAPAAWPHRPATGPPRIAAWRMSAATRSPVPPPDAEPPPAPAALRQSRAIVVGAGPVGCLVAAGLSARGVPVTLLERGPRAATMDVSRAYNFFFFARGLRALAAAPGLRARLAARAIVLDDAQLVRVRPNAAAEEAPQVKPLSPMPKLVSTSADASSDGTICAPRVVTVDVFRAFIADCCAPPRVHARYDSPVRAARLQPDGTVVVEVADPAAPRGLREERADFVVAADGVRSSLLPALRDPAHARVLESNHGFGETADTIPSSSLRQKSILVNADVGERFGAHATAKQPAVAGAMPERDPTQDALVLLPHTRGRPRQRQFKLAMFGVREDDAAAFGGRIASIVLPPDHALWAVRCVDEGFALFQENFPSVDVRTLISEESMARFVSSEAKPFAAVRRTNSVAAVVGAGDGDGEGDGEAGDAGKGAVLLLGDAAHSFPPDLGQGVNSGLEDAGVLCALLDKMPTDATLADIARAYAEERGKDIDGLRYAMLHGLPYQYQQDMTRQRLIAANNLLRFGLWKALPGVFQPTAALMAMASDLRYSEIQRRADVTTRRIYVLAAGIALALGLLAQNLLG